MDTKTPADLRYGEPEGADLILLLTRSAAREWRAIVWAGIIGALLAWLVNFALPELYTAQMVVGPKTSSILDRDTTGLKGIGALSTLAKLQGQTGDTMYDQYAAVLYSQDLANVVLKDKAIIGTIFKLRWQDRANRWQRPSGVVFELKQLVKGLLGVGSWRQPSTANVTKYLKRHLRLQLDRATGFATLSYSDKDPRFTADFLLIVHSVADNLVRQRILTISQERVEFLNEQLKQTTFEDHRASLINLLIEESRTVMIARADPNFAVEVIDGVVVPDRPSSPKRVQNILLGFGVGAILAALAFAALGGRLRDVLDQIHASVGRVPVIGFLGRKLSALPFLGRRQSSPKK